MSLKDNLVAKITGKIMAIADPTEGLSSEQLDAYHDILAWYASRPDEPFVLKGYAGSGKSFLLARVVQSLQQRGDIAIALCAPTHKACAVLRQFAASNNIDVDVSTLHSLLGLVPDGYDKMGAVKFKPSGLKDGANYQSYDLVCCDESSMIGKELYQHIPKSDIPTIFIGDPAQLPPVEIVNEDIKTPTKHSPVFDLPVGVELTQVERYSGAIAEYATTLRNNLEKAIAPRIVTKGNLIKLPPDEWKEALIDSFDGIDMQANPYKIRALAWTNKRVTGINNALKIVLYPHRIQDYLPGERLTAKEPLVEHTNDGTNILMQSCEEATVAYARAQMHTLYTGTSEDSTEEDIVVYEVNLETDTGKSITALLPAFDSLLTLTEYFGNWRKSILDLEPSDRRIEWIAFYQKLESLGCCFKGGSVIARLQYAYALTIHQSQGATFENVFLDAHNVRACSDPITRNQLLYVGATRASKRLIVSSAF
jgi:AAA domain/UvrD-like helicase C-terminal domain